MLQQSSKPQLAILNRNPSLIEGPGLLHDLVQSESTALAIDFLEDGFTRSKISYRSLHALSDALAEKICRATETLENASAIVPVLLPQSPQLYITLLAILKAGKAFCPLSLETPDERIKFILNDISADIIITHSSHEPRLASCESVQPVLVDQELANPRPHSSPCITPIRTSDLAYILYTSGSTGVPKAVSVSHRAVTQSLLAHNRHIPQFTRFLQFAAPTFDVSIFEIFFPLFRGCTLVGCSRNQMLNDLPAVVNMMEVDAAELTPTVVNNLLQGRKSVPRLRLLLTIGEMLTHSIVEEFGGNSSQTSILWGMYGPTEAAIHCTLQPAFQANSAIGTIGFPLDTVSAFIVAPYHQGSSPTELTPLLVGEVGELVVGGPQIADEYLNRPEITAAAFVHHPEFGLVYRTGDKARLLYNGTLECLGRIASGQIKLRGQRVELGEIEQVVSAVNGCYASAAIVINEELIAFCAAGFEGVTTTLILDSCKRWLPGYMVPTDVVILARMPQLSSGKIDKKALESSYISSRKVQLDDDSCRVKSGPNLVIMDVLQEVLGQGRSQPLDLPLAGVDSLRSIRIASLLRGKGYQLGAIDVLSAASTQDFIDLCNKNRLGGAQSHFHNLARGQNLVSANPQVKDSRANILDIIPCTPLQEAMLSETMVNADAYSNWIEVELSLPHTFQQIYTILHRIAKENEILRSGFQPSSGAISASFVHVIWNELSESQIIKTTEFSRSFPFDAPESVLRPFRVQVNADLAKPRLFFQLHHALYDGWSFDLLARDLHHLIEGQNLRPRLQFREVERYYSQQRDDEKMKITVHWKNVLEGFSPSPFQSFTGKIVRNSTFCSTTRAVTISLDSARKCSKQLNIHPQVLFQTATAYMVGSYTASTDVVIGTVTSGRTIPVAGIEDIMGPCIATLPLRLNFPDYSTIEEMFGHIRSSNRSMLENCTLPLRDIKKACGIAPGSRLFNVLFVWQESLISVEKPSPSVKVVDSRDNLEFDLVVEFEPRDNYITLKTTYNTAVFSNGQIEHLSRQIDEVSQYLISHPKESLDGIGQCFSADSLSIANPTPEQKIFQYGISHAVERWAMEVPGREAFVLGELINGVMTPTKRLSYAALNRRANQLARTLLECDVGKDELVCIFMDKSINLYISILAVLKTGSGYLPIVPESPKQRTSTILADARVKVCLTESTLPADALDHTAYTVMDVDTLDLSTYSEDDLAISYDGSRLAYAVFTSGSTGTPKGVLVTQDNLMSNLDSLHELYPTSKDSRLLQACSQAFDVSVFEIFFTWYAGMCLCTATKDDLFHSFEDAIDSLDITHLSLTPTVASLVNPDHVPKVRFLVTAGEAVNELVKRQWSGRGLYQGYGPSETTNICTVKACVSGDDAINNIGTPFKNTSAFVLDPKSDKIVSRGTVGELCFGGAQVFRGYLNQPDLNATKIIQHPVYGRLYRSGDLGLLLSDDSILFAGRLDDQVKIRGQRVELGEITSTVLDNSSVEDCITLLLEHGNTIQRLVSFWVPNGQTSADFNVLASDALQSSISKIFESLESALPEYMLPTHIIPISRIPLTTQTKVDKRLLQTTYWDLPKSHVDLTASVPFTSGSFEDLSEDNMRIASALAETLNIPVSEVKPSSSFFGLGLDSISAIQFSTRLRNQGIVDAPVSIILKYSTIKRLTSWASQSFTPIAQRSKISELSQLLPSSIISQISSDFQQRSQQVENILPCTPLQEAMLSSQTSTGSYFNTTMFDVHGDMSVLAKAWSLMFERHQILRTAFVPTSDPQHPFVQVVLSYKDPKWDDLNAEEDVQAFAQNRLSTLLENCEPPVRLATIIDSNKAKMIFCCHHAVYDGTAISTLLKEIEEAYNGHELPSPASFNGYLQQMMSHDLNTSDEFWRLSLANFEPTYFPGLRNNVGQCDGQSLSTAKLRTPLSQVLGTAKIQSVSLLPMVQAAWAKLLYFYLGESDVCFGNIVSGRTLPEKDLDRLVAPCFNTLPVRLNFDFGKSNKNLIQQLHAINIDILSHQLTPLRRIQAKAQIEGRHLFDTLVILQQPSEPLDESIWSLEQDFGSMDLPIVCEVFQNPKTDSLTLTLHHSTSLLSEDDAKVMVETFDHALLSLLTSTDSPARDTTGFPSEILAQSNLDYILLDISGGGMLHSAFEQNVNARAHGVALDFQNANGERISWTFELLNGRANQIAHTLIEHDIGPEDIIPIHMVKCPAFYATILGILKAGAAFTPIHPDLPDARKQFMLCELRPKVLLCTDQAPFGWSGDTVILDVASMQHPSKDNPVVEGLSPSNLAYCLYTSGSTGVPKAVAMEHRAPIQTVESSRSLVPWNNNSRLLQYAATTFDMCYYDCFLAWSFGFTLCAAEQGAMLDDLTNIIRSLDVTLLDLTPSVATSLTRSDIPSVEWLYCIGEAMTPGIIRQWEGACVNSYGPTEAAFCTTIFSVQQQAKSTVIGTPFPSTSFTVFPRKGEHQLPILALGELYIGGTQLARGYHGRRELTQDKFVRRDGQMFYKTGDLVRMLSDGNFEFVGRADDQVKIRGLRVELGEINQVLQGCDDVIGKVSTQILKRSAETKEQLVAFFTTRKDLNFEEQAELKEKAKMVAQKNLPSYMLPQFYIFVEGIPSSVAGKIDKKALARIFSESKEAILQLDGAAEGRKEHDWTETELQVRGILANLSGTAPGEVDPNTSIYQLGLDSISAVQVAAGLRKLGLQLSAADVLRYPNCVELAFFINNASSTGMSPTSSYDFVTFEKRFRSDVLKACNLRSEDIEVIRPCTPLQRGMISQFIAKEGEIYLNSLRLKLGKNVNISKLKEAWTEIKKRHRILRTGFAHIEDSRHSFAMIHYAPTALPLPWEEVASNAARNTSDQWLRNIRADAVEHLQQPPWRIRVTESQDGWYMNLGIFHALFDATSLQTIFTEVSTTYRGLHVGSPMSIDPLIGAIINLSNNQDKKRIDFWADLGKEVIPTRFPNLAPLRYEPTTPLFLTKSCTQSLSDLEAECRRSNVTLQAIGIASWVSLLSAYTGEPIVTCGVVLSGRTFEAAESAVFPSIVTVPFVGRASEDKRELLETIMKYNTDVQQHQFTPLNEIQRLMGFPDEPLFDSIFAFQKFSGMEPPHDLWSVVDEQATIEYPVSIELEPTNAQLNLRITFMPHLIPEEQATLILSQLDQLITDFASLNRETVLDDPKLYSISPPKDATIQGEAKLLHEFVEITAAHVPDRIAFEFATSIGEDEYSSKSWTYAELNAEGNRIAHLLISQNVQPGNLIGVCFEKCPEASFAMLGVLKVGCAFLALDAAAPAARQAYILKDSGAKVVLSMKRSSQNLPSDGDAMITNLDETNMYNFSDAKPALERAVDPQDRSYCLYTSGTTGTPKGCELTHENAVQALLSFQRLFASHWGDDSRWLQFASFHFDVSVLEQYWSWSVGIRVISAPRDLIFEDIARSIRVLGVTHIDLTPSLARIVHPDDVPGLCRGVFITGGESLKQEILDVWGPKGVIYNGYGPTEATIGCTMYPRVPTNGKPSNIGAQFDNVGSYVLRPGSDVPVLRGGVGELCVSGKLVGKGYLNRPELTDERFPFLGRFGERVYRTGDLVRILHDGTFDFLGRADDQVKLRGQRLEIGEINSVIRQSGGNADAATLVLKHPKHQKEQLVSFVVANSKAKAEPRILLEKSRDLDNAREACVERLPGYMVPTHFVPLTTMPLNANNKADGRRLRQMYEALGVSDLQMLSGHSSQKDDTWSDGEQKIRDTLAKLLQLNSDEMGKNTSFYELGLDSITIIGFSRALKQAGFVRASVSIVMKNTTFYRLAKALSEGGSATNNLGSIAAAQQSITAIAHRHRRGVAEALHTDPREIEALAPCTPLQHGMIARSIESDQGLYFNSFHFKLADDIDIDKLQTAWGDVFHSTQVLRTVFANTDDGFVQAVFRRLRLPWEDHTTLSSDNLGTDLDKLKEEWWKQNRTILKRPFELVLVSGPTSRILAVHIFHGLYDGVSIELLFNAVWRHYIGQAKGLMGPLFHSVLPYGPLRVVDGAQAFWQRQITNTQSSLLQSFIGESPESPLTIIRQINNLDKYESIRRQLNVTHQAIAQACWATVLQNYNKGPVVLGTIVSGRTIDFEEVDLTIGPLFNTLPYPHRIQSTETWTSIIKKTHEFNVAVHPYQHSPLRDIMKWCKRSTSMPLFDTLFVYQVMESGADGLKNDFWELWDTPIDADYPLAIEVEQREGQSLKLTLVAQGHVLDKKTAMRLLDEFETALKEVLLEPDTVVHSPHKRVTEEQVDNADAAIGRSYSRGINVTEDFTWTKPASMIRKDLANLSGTEENEISATTSILELGLDSIDAIKLSSKLKKRGIELLVSDIMRGLTITNMMDKISTTKKGWAMPPSDMIFNAHKKRLENYVHRRGIETDNMERILPLTPLQEGMVAEMVGSEYTRYYNHDVMQLAPETNLEKLRTAWTVVVKNSPILRTSFIEIDDPNIDFTYAQVVHATPHAFWETIEVKEDPKFAVIFDSIRNGVAQMLLPGPLFHVHIVVCMDRTYAVLSISHALYDGWSLGLLHNDVHLAYTDQYRPRLDYEKVLREILTASGSDAVAFWRDFLSDARPSKFPLRARTREAGSASVHRLERNSNLSLSTVVSFAKQNSVSLQTLGQTVYALVLASYTHSLEVTFGSVLSGRDSVSMTELLFPTMNTVAIRNILHGTRREMLQYVQENFTNIKQWQHFPLRRAQALAGVQGSLFESLFIYQKRLNASDEEKNRLYESIEGQSDVEYPVCVEMEVIGEHLLWRCAAKDEVFSEEESNTFLQTMDSVLEAIINRPDASTINFALGGTSVCGLPPFKDEKEEKINSNPEVTETDITKLPESPTANTIREILAFVSQTPESEITEGMTIFHMGLDSISAIKVSSLLHKRGIILGVGEMLSSGSVEKMTQVVDGRAATPKEQIDDPKAILTDSLASVDHKEILSQASIAEEEVEQMLPASAGQVYMLSMFLNSHGAVFYPLFTYQLGGSVTFDTLQQAWQDLVYANPILRTIFVATNRDSIAYVQVVLRSNDTLVVDTTGWDEQQITVASEGLISKQPHAHLLASPKPTGWTLRLKIHHALYDGVSLPLLMQQFEEHCNGTSILPSASNTAANFSKFLASSGSPRALEKRKDFWTAYLKGVHQRSPSLQHMIPATSKTAIFTPRLVPSTGQLQTLAKKNGITINALFLVIYARLYHALGSPSLSSSAHTNTDVVIGIYLANRSHHTIPTLSRAAIPTVNLVPLRVSINKESHILEIARQVQYDLQNVSSAVNAGVGLWEIKAWTGISVDTWVNWLALPEPKAGADDKKDGEDGSGSDDQIKIKQVGEWNEPVSRVTVVSNEDFKVPRHLAHERVNEAYLHSIDVEATIRDGALDVGIFAPTSMLSLEAAQRLMEGLKAELEALGSTL
ncbi:hypothetical protein P154DRAFT_522786, partial [Amniculicola lignicola CBS 123094]